jgi:hypothetical protein
MWIASKLGFFSIVTSGPEIQIRGRFRQDLLNLQRELHRADSRYRIKLIATPKADYGYRAIVSRAGLHRVMQLLADTVDYPNFKSMIEEQPDQRDKHDTYLAFWSGMLHLYLYGPTPRRALPDWFGGDEPFRPTRSLPRFPDIDEQPTGGKDHYE